MTQGLVLYTDGGARPNPGPAGWGMHGYLYLAEKPKKGSGNPDHILTAEGYVTKVEAGRKLKPDVQAEMIAMVGMEAYQMAIAAAESKQYEEVTPVHYIDGFGSFPMDVTNNVAELTGAIRALEHAWDYDIKKIRIFTDSEYVVNNIASRVDVWAMNGWTTSKGEPVKNIEYWKELSEWRKRLEARGVDLEFAWVKGHTNKIDDQEDILGNIKADRLATLAVLTSRRLGESNNNITVTQADGYWSYTPEKHPFIASRSLYFNTKSSLNTPGHYYLGNHGKEDELLGKRMSDGAFAVVRLMKPDTALELIRNYQTELSKGTDNIVLARLDQLYRPDTHKEIMLYGTRALEQPNPYRLDLVSLDNEPITRELRPPKLAMRAVESIGDLTDKLERYLAGHSSIAVTDLTPILYETTEKVSKKGDTAKVTMALKAKYNVGYAALEVTDAEYRVGETDTATASVMLTLGIDLLDRNALKRLESSNPTVHLITWLEAPQVFRYATVIKAGDDIGIWAGVYGNLRIVSE